MKHFKQFVTEMYGKGKLPAIKAHHDAELSKHLAAHREKRGAAQKDFPTKNRHMADHHANQSNRAKRLSDPKFSHKKMGYQTQADRHQAKDAKRKADQYE